MHAFLCSYFDDSDSGQVKKRILFALAKFSSDYGHCSLVLFYFPRHTVQFSSSLLSNLTRTHVYCDLISAVYIRSLTVYRVYLLSGLDFSIKQNIMFIVLDNQLLAQSSRIFQKSTLTFANVNICYLYFTVQTTFKYIF